MTPITEAQAILIMQTHSHMSTSPAFRLRGHLSESFLLKNCGFLCLVLSVTFLFSLFLVSCAILG